MVFCGCCAKADAETLHVQPFGPSTVDENAASGYMTSGVVADAVWQNKELWKDAQQSILEDAMGHDVHRDQDDFYVYLRRFGKKLGIGLGTHDSMPGKVYVRSMDADGAIQDWNASHEHSQVTAGAQIVEADGHRDAEKIIAVLQEAHRDELMLLVKPKRDHGALHPV
mmetsp:Transcript_44593/g.81409  ORF Transcript_44593/g.81409 Transcript_44593/m.81409 type:complete len:168 (-) Transcript_44593:32-535(-)